MKRYYKREAESELGIGIAFLEVTGRWPSRQVEVYGQTWLVGDETHPENLADQPLENLELGEEHEISSAEFDRMWTEALERCRSRL
jgi:hypothetical protein